MLTSLRSDRKNVLHATIYRALRRLRWGRGGLRSEPTGDGSRASASSVWTRLREPLLSRSAGVDRPMTSGCWSRSARRHQRLARYCTNDVCPTPAMTGSGSCSLRRCTSSDHRSGPRRFVSPSVASPFALRASRIPRVVAASTRRAPVARRAGPRRRTQRGHRLLHSRALADDGLAELSVDPAGRARAPPAPIRRRGLLEKLEQSASMRRTQRLTWTVGARDTAPTRWRAGATPPTRWALPTLSEASRAPRFASRRRELRGPPRMDRSAGHRRLGRAPRRRARPARSRARHRQCRAGSVRAHAGLAARRHPPGGRRAALPRLSAKGASARSKRPTRSAI